MIKSLLLAITLFFNNLFHPARLPELPVVKTTPVGLFSKINQYRISQNLPTFKQDKDICLDLTCQNCSHGVLVSISNLATTNQILARLLAEDPIKSIILNAQYDQACITSNPNTLSLLFAQRSVITKSQSLKPSPHPITSDLHPNPTNFTESELWQALTIYREAQKVKPLERDENLCVYARKRVEDHLSMIASIKPADYPNQDKYPLDGHRGFSKDAESGFAFDVTKTTRLAENLAYYPGAKNATQIIEWGWDTSTEGHRETQLSNDWSKACLTGKQGFYVAIFGL
jgi:hypothetical protein